MSGAAFHARGGGSSGRRARATLGASAAAAALALACGHDTTAPKPGPPSVRVLAGANATDTVLTALTQALVVEVRDTLRKPVSGVVVRFQSVPGTIPSRQSEWPLYVCPLEQSSCASAFGGGSTFATDTTDAQGRARIAVQLGTIAGPTWLRITVPDLGVVDSAAYTVLPGGPSRVQVDVADTSVYVADSYDLHAAVADAFGNPRPEAVTFSSDAHVTVSAAGVVTGRTLGRGHITVSRGSATATALVSVLPHGHIVTYRTYGPGPSALVEFDLNGSGYRARAPMSGGVSGLTSWLGGGDALFHDYWGATVQILRANAGGAVSVFLRDPAPPVTAYAQPSRDGAYVYFQGGGGAYAWGIYRARGDGTQVEAVAGAEGGEEPAPSPDGSRVAFYRSGTLNVVTVATGAVIDLGVRGVFPRWSPVGDLIAYTPDGGGPISVVSANGGVARVVSDYPSYGIWLDWSPDAQWIVASNFGQIELVRVSDGETLPVRLPQLGGHFQPGWR